MIYREPYRPPGGDRLSPRPDPAPDPSPTAEDDAPDVPWWSLLAIAVITAAVPFALGYAFIRLLVP
jgi:hypothetical protein